MQLNVDPDIGMNDLWVFVCMNECLSLLRTLTAVNAANRRKQSSPRNTVARLYAGKIGVVVSFSE